jgi:hypothetical protein
VEFAGGDYVSRPLVFGDSLGDIADGCSSEAIGLGEDEPWRRITGAGLTALFWTVKGDWLAF